MSCVFCDIASGTTPAVMIHEGDHALAFLPRAGWLAPGHTLVVPRAHAVDLFDVDEVDLIAAMRLVRELSNAMVATLGAGGVNVLNASGPFSEQSVFHLHFHVVPRWEGDGFTSWPSERSNREPVEDFPTVLSAWWPPSP